MLRFLTIPRPKNWVEQICPTSTIFDPSLWVCIWPILHTRSQSVPLLPVCHLWLYAAFCCRNDHNHTFILLNPIISSPNTSTALHTDTLLACKQSLKKVCWFYIWATYCHKMETRIYPITKSWTHRFCIYKQMSVHRDYMLGRIVSPHTEPKTIKATVLFCAVVFVYNALQSIKSITNIVKYIYSYSREG